MMKRNLKTLILIAVGLLVVLPVFMVLAASIKDQKELTESLAPLLGQMTGYAEFQWMPDAPTLQHYVKLLFQTPQFFIVFWNSVKLEVLIIAGQMFIAIPAAWAFGGYRFRFRRLLFTMYIVLMIMPFQVTMLSSYLVLNQLQMMNTHAAIILPAIFSTFPVFLIYQGFAGIPRELIEAARVDGAGEWFIFIKIGIPLASTGILSAMVLEFLEYWNLIEQPLAFLEDKSLWPLSLYLPEIGLAQAGLSFAASMITLIPAILIFIIGRDYLEQGIIASAIKE